MILEKRNKPKTYKKFLQTFPKRKPLFLFFMVFHLLSCPGIYADDEPANEPYDEPFTDSECLFLSLGSVCIPAGYIGESGLRSCGYMPFDWMCSKDGEKLIEILNDDFQHFFNFEYLLPYRENPRQENNLLHTYYHFEFVHDQDVTHDIHGAFFQKYERRIRRFRQLSHFKGRVVFIRYASNYDPDCYWQFPEHEEISDSYAIRLYDAMRDRFPALDFILLIMNRGYGEIFEPKRRIAEHVWTVKFNPGISVYNPNAAQERIRTSFKDFLLGFVQN